MFWQILAKISSTWILSSAVHRVSSKVKVSRGHGMFYMKITQPLPYHWKFSNTSLVSNTSLLTFRESSTYYFLFIYIFSKILKGDGTSYQKHSSHNGVLDTPDSIEEWLKGVTERNANHKAQWTRIINRKSHILKWVSCTVAQAINQTPISTDTSIKTHQFVCIRQA